jgi:hypothetical protein
MVNFHSIKNGRRPDMNFVGIENYDSNVLEIFRSLTVFVGWLPIGDGW